MKYSNHFISGTESKRLNQFIIDNYGKIPTKELINKFGIDIPERYVVRRAYRLAQKHNIVWPESPKVEPRNSKWSKYDDILIKNYNTMITTNLIQKFNIPFSIRSVNSRIKILKKYTDNIALDHSKYDIFDNSLEAYYWLGFLFADGHFAYNRTIYLHLATKDLDHMKKFKKFTKSDSEIEIRTNIIKPSKNSKINIKVSQTESCTFNITDTVNIKKLCDKFKISNTKTYNPPLLRTPDMTDDQFLALIIGFIDGDGCIYSTKNNDIRIILDIHKNWLDNLKFIETELYRIININYVKLASKITNRGQAKLELNRIKITTHLKQFIIEHKLPALDRKWNQIDETRIPKVSKTTIEIDDFILKNYERLGAKGIIKELDLDLSTAYISGRVWTVFTSRGLPIPEYRRKTRKEGAWTPYDQILIDNCGIMSGRELMEKFNIPFSPGRISVRICYLRKKWKLEIPYKQSSRADT